MGCVYSIVAYALDPGAAKQALEAALDEVDRIDRLASLYRRDSALSRLNAASGGAAPGRTARSARYASR